MIDVIYYEPDVARVVPVEADVPVGSSGDAESAVVAALILTTGGDLDAALADGVVTQADIDAAIQGLETGAFDELFD